MSQLGPGLGVRAVAVNAGSGCVAPRRRAVLTGAYGALARSLYLDVSLAALRRPEARAFMREYLHRPPPMQPADGVLAVPLSHRLYRKFTRP